MGLTQNASSSIESVRDGEDEDRLDHTGVFFICSYARGSGFRCSSSPFHCNKVTFSLALIIESRTTLFHLGLIGWIIVGLLE